MALVIDQKGGPVGRPAAPTPPPKEITGLGVRITAGIVAVALLVIGLGGWAATATLSGAVIASGLIVVEGSTKKIQHPTGGVVGEIRVKTGDRVQAGDILIRLDDTQTKAALGIITSQLSELIGRRARLMAQREEAPEIAFPDGFENESPDTQRIAAGERRLFTAKRNMIDAQKKQLGERIGQYKQEIEGLTVQRDAKEREVKLVEDELERMREMSSKELIPITRLLASEREAIRVKAEYGALVAQIARTNGQISETEVQMIALVQQEQSEGQTELRETEARIGELSERRIAAEDQLKRVDIRAPHSGLVHELTVHTVGAVIGPGEVLMQIVPEDDTLAAELRISPSDIDQLALGQKTMLRFAAFNQRTTPEVAGTLTRIAADLTVDQKTGQAYYVVRAEASPDELHKLQGLKLLPGMPVEGFIETSHRTALTYFTKPLADQFAKAFRED